MPIGPQLPPQAEKRKRSENEDSNDSDDSVGPLPPGNGPPSPGSKKPRMVGPSLPSPRSTNNTGGPEATSKKHENSDEDEEEEEEDDDDDDDDFGPSLPPPPGSKPEPAPSLGEISTATSTQSTAPKKVQRDEWMTLAPTNGDWSQRVDPTKMKSRKFNTSRSVNTGSSKSDAWNETPEQKQARLKREVLGVKSQDVQKTMPVSDKPSQKDIETAQRIKEYNTQRGPSLYAAHQKDKSTEDDDPSARAFDREKDIGGGLQINATKRREMMKKSSDFNSRFSSAKYL